MSRFEWSSLGLDQETGAEPKNASRDYESAREQEKQAAHEKVSRKKKSEEAHPAYTKSTGAIFQISAAHQFVAHDADGIDGGCFASQNDGAE